MFPAMSYLKLRFIPFLALSPLPFLPHVLSWITPTFFLYAMTKESIGEPLHNFHDCPMLSRMTHGCT